MSQRQDRTPGPPRPPGPGSLGAGLTVAAVLVVVARWLPISFSYHANTLGIESITTRAAYPSQQEPILFLGFGAAGVLLVWLLAAVLAARRFEPRVLAGFQGIAFAALLGALMLPTAAATGVVAAALLGLAALLRRSGRAPPADGPGEDPAAGFSLALTLGIVLLSVVRVPRLLQGAAALLRGVPDAALTRNDWVFLSEDGQHLAWADSLLQGGFHGKDFFCLYGPLYDWSVVWIWKLFGRSVAGWHLHTGVTETLAWLGFLALAALLLRRRWLLLPLAVLVPHLSLRIGLGYASLFFLLRHGRSRGIGGTADALLAGLLAGAGLFYSQEFGAVAVACAALLFFVRPSAAGLVAYGFGVLAVAAPILGLYARADALAPMVDDVVGYPGLLIAGFGNLPFPSLRASLPLSLDPSGTGLLRLFYATPAITAAALGAALPRCAPHPRSPVRWLLALRAEWAARPRQLELALLALFGLAAFRTALGRSDQIHLYAVVGPAILLLAVGADRLLDRRHAHPGPVALQLALGALVVLLGGILTGPGAGGWFHLTNTARTLAQLAEPVPAAPVHGAVNRVASWLEEHAGPDDRFYFLPNDAAFYYLVERPPPTRFVVSHQMVTDAHRAEALRDLQAAPPRYVVWNDATLRLDGIEDESVLGPALWEWLHAHYAPVHRLGGMRIWEYAPEAAQSR